MHCVGHIERGEDLVKDVNIVCVRQRFSFQVNTLSKEKHHVFFNHF